MATKPVSDTADTKPADGKAVPKSYVPEGYKAVDEYLADMREEYRLDVEADKENRDAAMDDLKFASGDQWDAQVRAQRQPATGPSLPCLTINTIPQFIGQLIGDRRVNQVSIKVLPKEDGDIDIASIRSDLVRNIEVQSRAERVYTAAFEDMATCGVGNFEICTEYANDDVFDQDIAIKQIVNPLGVVWDRMSVDPTGRDAGHCFVDDRIPKKVFELQYPEHQPSDLGKELRSDLAAEGWQDDETTRITAHWRMITRPRRLALLVDGSVKDITSEPIDAELIARDAMDNPRIRTVQKKFAQRHLVTGHAILEGPYEMAIDRLPVIRMNGREVRMGEKRVRYGLVRSMKDPQRLNNFYQSKYAEGLGYSTTAHWLVSSDAIEGREQMWNEDHITHRRVLVYKKGAEKPSRLDPRPPDTAMLQAIELCARNMRDTTGIHEAGLGMASNETSGKAIIARQREGDIASVVYHDNANAAILEGGDVINQLIPGLYDAARTIRVVGEDGEPRLQRINDPMDPKSIDLSSGKYDVTITTGASYTTRRVEALESMTEAIRAGGPELFRVIGDLWAKSQDWPNADEFAERMRKIIPPELLQEDDENGPQIPPQLEQMIQQMMEQMQVLQAENQQLQDTRELEMGKLRLDAFGKQIEAYRAETERQKETDGAEVEHIKGLAEFLQAITPDYGAQPQQT